MPPASLSHASRRLPCGRFGHLVAEMRLYAVGRQVQVERLRVGELRRCEPEEGDALGRDAVRALRRDAVAGRREEGRALRAAVYRYLVRLFGADEPYLRQRSERFAGAGFPRRGEEDAVGALSLPMARESVIVRVVGA